MWGCVSIGEKETGARGVPARPQEDMGIEEKDGGSKRVELPEISWVEF